MPVSPRRWISCSVTAGTPEGVTYRIGASSGKGMSGTAELAAIGSLGVTRVTPQGRSGTLLFSAGLFSGMTAGHSCWVTDTASSYGLVPQMRVVVFVV